MGQMSQELTRLTMEISDHRLSDFSIVKEIPQESPVLMTWTTLNTH